MEKLQIKKTRTTPLRPQTVGMVERHNICDPLISVDVGSGYPEKLGQVSSSITGAPNINQDTPTISSTGLRT